MSGWRPTPAEERWQVLGERHPLLRTLARAVPEAGPWRRATLLTRCLLFVFGVFAAGLSLGVIRLFGLPLPGIVTGCVLLGVAELLIRRRHLFASGIEEALWASGAATIGFEWLELLRGSDVAALSWMATFAAITGWRLLNPLFTTLAVLLASVALALFTGGGGLASNTTVAGLACFLLGGAALAAGAARFQRPSHDRMLDWLVVTLPLAGYFWLRWNRNAPLTLQALRELDLATLQPLLLVVVYSLVALWTGMRRRTHAPLFAALACVPLLAFELRAVTGLALHWRLMLWGGLGLLLAILVERRLREPRRGLTSRDVEGPLVALELAQLGGTALTSSQTSAHAAGATTNTAPAPRVEGQGGSFGGGGASGRF